VLTAASLRPTARRAGRPETGADRAGAGHLASAGRRSPRASWSTTSAALTPAAPSYPAAAPQTTSVLPRGGRSLTAMARLMYWTRSSEREDACMSVETVWPRLEPLLPRVSKPIQYVGGELGAQVKDWDSVAVRWALMYPDAYEVG